MKIRKRRNAYSIDKPFLRFITFYYTHLISSCTVYRHLPIFLDIRLLVESLALYKVIRDHAESGYSCNVRLTLTSILESSSSVRKQVRHEIQFWSILHCCD